RFGTIFGLHNFLIMRRRNPAIHETTDMPPSPGWALPSRGGRSLSRTPNFVAVSPTSGLTSGSARFITRYIRGIFQSLPIHPSELFRLDLVSRTASAIVHQPLGPHNPRRWINASGPTANRCISDCAFRHGSRTPAPNP